MKKETINIMLIIVGILIILNPVFLHPVHVDAVKSDAGPFDKIPMAIINSNNIEYKIGADFSIDYGDNPVISGSNDSIQVNDMKLNKNDKELSVKLECDSNDICGTSLAPSHVAIYLVKSNISDEQIANGSVSKLELGYNDCGIETIEKCANFDFSIPSNIPVQNYNIVLDMSFDEARWIFINPVNILE